MVDMVVAGTVDIDHWKYMLNEHSFLPSFSLIIPYAKVLCYYEYQFHNNITQFSYTNSCWH